MNFYKDCVDEIVTFIYKTLINFNEEHFKNILRTNIPVEESMEDEHTDGEPIYYQNYQKLGSAAVEIYFMDLNRQNIVKNLTDKFSANRKKVLEIILENKNIDLFVNIVADFVIYGRDEYAKETWPMISHVSRSFADDPQCVERVIQKLSDECYRGGYNNIGAVTILRFMGEKAIEPILEAVESGLIWAAEGLSIEDAQERKDEVLPRLMNALRHEGAFFGSDNLADAIWEIGGSETRDFFTELREHYDDPENLDKYIHENDQ